jgi:hypothetical protein
MDITPELKQAYRKAATLMYPDGQRPIANVNGAQR